MDQNTGSFMGGGANISPALQRAMQGGGTPTQQPPLTSQVSTGAPTFNPQTQGAGMPPMPGMGGGQPMGGSSLPMPSMNPQDTSIIIKALANRLNADSSIQKSAAGSKLPS